MVVIQFTAVQMFWDLSARFVIDTDELWARCLCESSNYVFNIEKVIASDVLFACYHAV